MINNLILVSMPYIVPTSPPLGIASLKSYIESNSKTQVTCIDINQLFTQDMINTIQEENKTIDQKAKEFLEISKLLKTDELYADELKLKQSLKAFSDFLTTINNNTIKTSKEYLQGERTDLDLMDKYTETILIKKPELIGFSIGYPDQLKNSIAMAKRLKEKNPNIKIIFGGSLLDKSKKYSNFFKKHKLIVDYIIYDQGESGLLALVKGKELTKIPNLVYMKDNETKQNHEGILTNFENVPFADFSDFKLSEYYTPNLVLPILSAKGCYWRRCSFCTHHNSYSHKYAAKNVKRFVEELEHYNKTYRAKYFYFSDEMISAPRFEKIADEIISKRLNINYSALVKPTNDFSLKILEKMHKSGCTILISGIESGNQRILDLIDKGTNVKANEEFLKHANIAGIKNVCYIFIGFPTETKEELEDTKNFIVNNEKIINYLLIAKFLLEENSLIMKNPEKFQIIIKEPIKINNKTVINNFEVLTKDGIQPNSRVYQEYLDFFQNFKGGQYGLGRFREHMLIYYSKI
jgi:anaerobic magnesium-protoporphyrin IX monomethyl ester cyclase